MTHHLSDTAAAVGKEKNLLRALFAHLAMGVFVIETMGRFKTGRRDELHVAGGEDHRNMVQEKA